MTSVPTPLEAATVWFIRDLMLVSSAHVVSAPSAVADIVDELLAGPSESDADNGLRTAITDSAVVTDVTLARGTASVSLTNAFAEIPAPDQVLAIGQLVLTLTDLRGVGRVQFSVDGTAVAVPLPGGEATDDAVTRDDYVGLTSS